MRNDLWAWVESFTNLEKTPDQTKRTWRLDRMRQLLEMRGNPHRGRLTIHVAGSKGKGSTCAFLASILEEAGYSTGLYTSPHLSDYRERITRNGIFFPPEIYEEVLTDLRSWWSTLEKNQPWAPSWGGPPTTFEFLTLAAFEIFRKTGMAAQVIETGLGGRLDATNTVEPDAVVLTLIEKEHTEILGDTLTLIATEKAGIIKAGVPVFSAVQPAEALDVFRRTCQDRGAPLTELDQEMKWLIQLHREGTGLKLDGKGGPFPDIHLKVLGYAQGQNAALAALTASRLLSQFSRETRGQLIKSGLEKTQLTGRMQVIPGSPLLVLDGAHTKESVGLLARTWKELWGTDGNLLFGTFLGKDAAGMAQALKGLFAHVWITPPGFYRPSDPQAMEQAFLNAGYPSPALTVVSSPQEALVQAQKSPAPLLVCGSFYLVSEVLDWISNIDGNANEESFR